MQSELPSNAHSSLSEGILTKRKCTWCEQCFTHCTAHWMSENPHLGETLASVEKASNRTMTFLPIKEAILVKI